MRMHGSPVLLKENEVLFYFLSDLFKNAEKIKEI